MTPESSAKTHPYPLLVVIVCHRFSEGIVQTGQVRALTEENLRKPGLRRHVSASGLRTEADFQEGKGGVNYSAAEQQALTLGRETEGREEKRATEG